MGKWINTANIKAILHEDQENESDEHVRKVAGKIADLLKAKLGPGRFDIDNAEKYDAYLSDIVENLESIKDDESEGLLSELNECLSSLYDWADVERVWLGL